jgi:hypothetical protein
MIYYERVKKQATHIVEMNGKTVGMKTLYLVVVFYNGAREM